MTKRNRKLIPVLIGLLIGALTQVLTHRNQSPPSHQADFPLWAYGYITPPEPPEDWSQSCLGSRPRDCDRPGGMPKDPTNKLLQVEGSELEFTLAVITSPFSPADWFPRGSPANA